MPHIIIIGAGFAGLECARKLAKTGYPITLIEQTNYHLFQPLLYQVAGAQLAPNDIAVPIREVLKKHSNIRVLMDEVTHIDSQHMRISLKTHGSLDYTDLILAFGNTARMPQDRAWHPYVTTLKSLPDTVRICEKILCAYEESEWSAQPPCFVIVGGGPTGVEMAGTLIEMAKRTLKNNFRKIHSDQTKITLIELSEHLLGSFGSQLGDYAKHTLQEMGVEVITNTSILDIQSNRLVLEGRCLQPNLIIWAAGTSPNPLAFTLNLPLSPDGRIPIDAYLAVKGLAHVYAIGDCAHYIQDERPLPALAPVAKQQGRYLAHNLLKISKKPFVYRDKGSLATIGKSKAVGRAWSINFKGHFAWLIWAVVHIYYLVGFGSKYFVFSKWLWSYFTGGRSSRLIYKNAKAQD